MEGYEVAKKWVDELLPFGRGLLGGETEIQMKLDYLRSENASPQECIWYMQSSVPVREIDLSTGRFFLVWLFPQSLHMSAQP
ncbi:hypothetical protein [Alicyclobacillus sp. SO9]|uniref:hypothetical protein n=1 Tax=Alicyclobacillus sp. SO9 TaxID=2665646 RepID=UPI0018E89796|nr:hypothetical protein [Alicyclobacillus sp. SO9]QQE78094.1 hypothetical protein GI364_19710 [Alicyclobacillus sp. SO9]